MNGRKKNTIIPQSNANIDPLNFEKIAGVPFTKVSSVSNLFHYFSFCFALIYGRRPVALFAACKLTIHLDFPKGFVVSLLGHVSFTNQETI